jgi:hypothetical protein
MSWPLLANISCKAYKCFWIRSSIHSLDIDKQIHLSQSLHSRPLNINLQHPSTPLPPRAQIQIQARTPIARRTRASSMPPSSRIPPRSPVLPPHRSASLTLQRLAQSKSLHQRTGVESAVRLENSHQSGVEKSILLFQRLKSFETCVDTGGGSIGGRGGARCSEILRGNVWESFAE